MYLLQTTKNVQLLHMLLMNVLKTIHSSVHILDLYLNVADLCFSPTLPFLSLCEDCVALL